MAKTWIEHIECPSCGKTGDAELSEVSLFENTFDTVPTGFKVVKNLYGGELECETCKVAALDTEETASVGSVAR
ncbi:hypothetical protein HUU61_12510 [Rhodopseudomonas palustris]|nr:hypothetical protein [Rhodopseudomonas palustris]